MLHLFKLAFIPLLLAPLGLICDGEDGPGNQPKTVIMQLDKSTYTPDELPQLTLINQWGQDLYLGHCGLGLYYDFEKNIDGDWVNPYGGLFCIAIGGPHEFADNDTLTWNIRIYGFKELQESFPGTFRLKLRIEEVSSRAMLPDSLLVSGPFTILAE